MRAVEEGRAFARFKGSGSLSAAACRHLLKPLRQGLDYAEACAALGLIRKVTLRTRRKPDVLVRGGAADRGEMTRVDVFARPNKRGKREFFLVPVYPHQVFDKARWPTPPDRAVQAYKPEADWPEMGADHAFLWSLYPMSYVVVDLGDVRHEGYFRGLDRSTGAINLSAHHAKDALVRGIGVKTAKDFRKYMVDRLGRRFPIERETRTWHGAACT